MREDETMLFDYATSREAIQAGWAYASGRLDERGEGDLPRAANANAFGEEYGRVWDAKRTLRRGELPILGAAWENWLRCHDGDLPLQLFGENCCCSCGDYLSDGLCPGGQCVPVDEREVYKAFRVLANAYERDNEYGEVTDAASKAADAVAQFGRYAHDGDTLRRWRDLYVADAVA
jgi:hypothetical protein